MFKKEKYSNSLFRILLVLLLISIAVMRYFDSFLITEKSPNGIVSFELAKESYMANEMTLAWDTTAKIAAGLSMGFDFLFLIIYASFISFLILKINKYLFLNGDKSGLGKVFLALPFLAAFFDIIENIALIKLLLGDMQQKWSLIAYYFAVTKFGILLIAIAYILIGVVVLGFKRLKK
ncbi:MAG: hypothetical protein DRJ07_15620 [Bacteroidetes bacterium]|nr:MAG: hypothetical protein DRJ07_15620 [Bacteroidota bacterium]